MDKKDTKFTSETARIAGQKSKRKKRDVVIAEKIDAYLEQAISKGDQRSRQDIMIEAAFKEWLKGNPKLMQYLMDRGFRKPKQPLEHSGDKDSPIIILTPEEKAIAEGKEEIGES